MVLKFLTCVLFRLDDGLLEVIGLYSSLHIGAIQVQMDQPLRIGQAQCVKVRNI